jgi:hypothetical protein
MKSQKFDYLLLVFIVSCLIFGGFTGCKKKQKVTDEVFQRVKVTNTEGVTTEVKNPEIDYTENDTLRYAELFGIRIQKNDETEPMLWNEIDHIDITTNNKASLIAKIRLANGNIITTDLVEDSQGGLSGRTDSGTFQIRLRNVKSIYVVKR